MKWTKLVKAEGQTQSLIQELEKLCNITEKLGRGIIIQFISDLQLNKEFVDNFDNTMLEENYVDDVKIYEQIKLEKKVNEAVELLKKINTNPENYILGETQISKENSQKIQSFDKESLNNIWVVDMFLDNMDSKDGHDQIEFTKIGLIDWLNGEIEEYNSVNDSDMSLLSHNATNQEVEETLYNMEEGKVVEIKPYNERSASKKHYFYIKEDFPAFDGDTRVAVIEEDENGEYFDWNYFDTYEEAEEFLKEMNKKIKEGVEKTSAVTNIYKVASDTKQIGRWLLKVVKNGETTNRGNGDFTNNGKGDGDAYDIVEIYDTKQDKNKFTQYGQFVSSYYVSTFLDIKNGLNMQGDIPEWTMSATEVKEAQEWLKSLYLNGTPRDFLEDTMEEFRRNMKSANKKIKSFNLKDIITKIEDRYHELMDIGSWSDAEWFKKGEYAYIYIPVNKFDFRKNVTTGETDKEAMESLEELSGQKVEIVKIKATIKGPYDVMTADAKPTLVDVRFEDGQVWEDVNTEWLKHQPFGEDEDKKQIEAQIEDNRHIVERISDLLDSGFEQEEIINIVCNEFECEPQEVEQFLRKVTYASKVVSEREAGKDLNLVIRKANKVLKGEEIYRWDIGRRDVAKSVAKNFEEITGVNINQLFTKVDDKYGSVIENVNAKLFDKQIPKIYKWVKNNFKIDKYDYETMQQDSDFIDMITDELVDMVDIDKVEYDKR